MKAKSDFKFLAKIIDAYPQLKYALLEAQTFDESHFGFPDIYYKIMETDDTRVDAFRNAFKGHKNLRHKIVCEAGVGTLALTKYYLPYVKKAYLIESNPHVIPLIKRELKKHGWDQKAVLIHGDALKVELPEPVDFVIGELMSIFCANELQVQIFQHLRRFLKPGGKLMPDKIVNIAQLCRAEFDEDHKHYPLMFTRHLPEQISTQQVVNTIDFYKTKNTNIQKKIRLRALLSGVVNAVYLHSLVQVSEGANFTGTDSLMPPTVLKLTRPLKVTAGDTIQLEANFQYGTSLDKAKFRAKRIS